MDYMFTDKLLITYPFEKMLENVAEFELADQCSSGFFNSSMYESCVYSMFVMLL
jgi:hypothetical protein